MQSRASSPPPRTTTTTTSPADPGGASIGDSIGDAILPGFILGAILYFIVRVMLRGLYTVDQNERAVKTVFGRAQRVRENATTLELPMAQSLRPDERDRYAYPQVVVIPPGGPYFKWPWEQIHKVSVATNTTNLAYDPDMPEANEQGQRLSAVTKDHLNTKISGQIRFRTSESNLYALLFAVKSPISHVLGYFVAVLRQRIASFEAPARAPDALALPAREGQPEGLATQAGVSINDLRKNLRDLNDRMEADCASSAARYGIVLDACLITGIDPPDEVESALAAINTAYNHVSSEISLAQAAADQRIVQSRRAVEIETLRVQAEAEPLRALSGELAALNASAPGTLDAYVRNLRLGLLQRARRVFVPFGGETGDLERMSVPPIPPERLPARFLQQRPEVEEAPVTAPLGHAEVRR